MPKLFLELKMERCTYDHTLGPDSYNKALRTQDAYYPHSALNPALSRLAPLSIPTLNHSRDSSYTLHKNALVKRLDGSLAINRRQQKATDYKATEK